MPRHQEFNTQETFEKIFKLFWEQGYNNTSLLDIQEATGVAKMSIRNKFGSKEEIFTLVARTYIDKTIELIKLKLSDRKLSNIIDFIETVIGNPQCPMPASKYGCMMVNSTLDNYEDNSSINKLAMDFHDKIFIEFNSLLIENDVPNSVQKTELLFSILSGIYVGNRLYQNSEKAEIIIEELKSIIKTWEQQST